MIGAEAISYGYSKFTSILEKQYSLNAQKHTIHLTYANNEGQTKTSQEEQHQLIVWTIIMIVTQQVTH